jgi:2-polyprenyl-3-methyl-5-hydroxy-6-metoxy-1,4-benzoquinol methylase
MCGSDEVRALRERTLRYRRWTLARCRGCGLHFTSPIPTEAELNSFYQGDYHRELRTVGATEAAFGPKYERYADTLGRYLRSGRVVDVGCSTGLLVRILCDRGYQAEGIELNRESAEWGRTHYGIQIHGEPLERCRFEPGSLDAVLMTDVLEHTRHPRDYLGEVGRLLRPGGFVMVTFPDIRSVESLYQLMLSRLLKRDWIWDSCRIPSHVWEFTRATAEACFTSAGFRVVEFRRHQPRPDDDSSPLAVRMLNLPIRPLQWPVSVPSSARRWSSSSGSPYDRPVRARSVLRPAVRVRVRGRLSPPDSPPARG